MVCRKKERARSSSNLQASISYPSLEIVTPQWLIFGHIVYVSMLLFTSKSFLGSITLDRRTMTLRNQLFVYSCRQFVYQQLKRYRNQSQIDQNLIDIWMKINQFFFVYEYFFIEPNFYFPVFLFPYRYEQNDEVIPFNCRVGSCKFFLRRFIGWIGGEFCPKVIDEDWMFALSKNFRTRPWPSKKYETGNSDHKTELQCAIKSMFVSFCPPLSSV